MNALKPDAETLRWSIALGILPVSTAVAWADALIAADRHREAPSILALALVREDAVAETVSLLGDIPGTCAPTAVASRLASILREEFHEQRIDLEAVARAMDGMLQEGLVPDDAFYSKAFRIGDGLEHLRAGRVFTREELAQDVRSYLSGYTAVPLDHLPRAA